MCTEQTDRLESEFKKYVIFHFLKENYFEIELSLQEIDIFLVKKSVNITRKTNRHSPC